MILKMIWYSSNKIILYAPFGEKENHQINLNIDLMEEKLKMNMYC